MAKTLNSLLITLVILEKSPFDVEPIQIKDINVLATIMDGNVTYKDKDFNL